MVGYEEIELEDPCSMCGEDEATTVWGVPVCESCAESLDRLDSQLGEMEAGDPGLKAAGDRLRAAERELFDGNG